MTRALSGVRRKIKEEGRIGAGDRMLADAMRKEERDRERGGRNKKKRERNELRCGGCVCSLR